MTSISNSRSTSYPTRGHSAHLWTTVGSYLHGRRLYVLALVVAAAGLALGGAWWGLAAILPLLYVLPCAAMVGMCMKGHGGSGKDTDAKPSSSANLISGPAIDQTGPR